VPSQASSGSVPLFMSAKKPGWKNLPTTVLASSLVNSKYE